MMPDNYGFKKSYPDPKPNLMRRFLNIDALSDSDKKANPELASAWAGREIEMPAETAATKSVRPMNWLERNTIGKEAAGITWPWGTIALNDDVIKSNKMNLGEVLAHELVHVGQASSVPQMLRNAYHNVKTGYGEQPREMEAFESTSHRPVRTKDISLDVPVRRKK